ncbi:2-oxoglutarate and iron-dependent oxygenase JMJD4 [Coccomyxa sp. Obi]|nr:2-oxoglutarate and iron-dependent oxygenase JMJD4 [Coccomyxa sp. Obi]
MNSVQVNEGDSAVLRRLQLASLVYNSWTGRGTDPASMAARLLDGSVDALEAFVSAANASPHDEVEQGAAQKGLQSPAASAHGRDEEPAAHSEPQSSAGRNCQSGIPRRHVDNLTYDAFVLEFMAPNLPVMIEGVTEGWQACEDWVTANGGINLQFMADNFGEANIWATAANSTASGYGGGRRHNMTVAQYVEWWRRHKDGQEEQLLYLKDWHFVNEFPWDDWLNDYYDMRQTSHETASPSEGNSSQENIVTSDYRFVYLGPKGTTTALHADVLRSFSWSVNVCGRKLWRLLPPQHTHLLYDRFGREMEPDFDLDASSRAEQFPNLAAARQHVVEVVQGVGEAIFVPSGWHHTVENLEDTLSINHNWLNAFNLHWGWTLLQRERAEAAAAIEDCRETCTLEEFEALVERNMAANCGLDFRAAAEFVGCIAARELHLIRQPATERAQRLMHLFNLRRALPVLEGLLARLDSSKASPEQASPAAYESSREAASSAAEVDSLASPAEYKSSRKAAVSAAGVDSLAPSDLGNGVLEGGQDFGM